jgi:hypothetical protein
MQFRPLLYVMLFLACAMPAFATVSVISPNNNSTVGTSFPILANSTTTCPQGVASSGIYVDNSLDYVVAGNSVNTTISLPVGKHYVVVQEWDYCGGATTAPLNLTVVAGASVTVTSPANGSTVGTPAAFVATSTSTCAKGVAAMGVYVNNSLVYQVQGSSLRAPIPLTPGSQTAVVQEWDYCGGSVTTPVNVNVTGTTIANVQAAPGWNQWGELPPVYGICSAPCPGLTWGMAQHQTNISTSGNSTSFYVGGTTPFADALFSNPVIGQGNQQGLTDSAHTLLPTLHNFIYDTDVYVSDLAVTQNLEFDINWYGYGLGLEWGTQCDHLGDGVWDIWNNVAAAWVPTNIPCQLNDGAWNHVTLQVQRENDNTLLYQSVTVNGVVHPINVTVAPFAVPAGWWGMTINFQPDGDYAMHGYLTYLDRTNFTYW